MWKLRPGWSVELVAGELFFRSDTARFRVSSRFHSLDGFPVALVNGAIGIDESDPAILPLRSLVRKLVERGIMMPDVGCEPPDFETSTSRQLEYFAHIGIPPRDALHRIRNSRVLLLGLGGIGSIVLQHLIAAGVQKLILVDDDIVERSNLERQFIYSQCDVGSEKTRAATDYVLARADLPDVRSLSQRLNTKEDLRAIITASGPIDFCLVCIDRPPASVFGNTSEVLWSVGVPFIHGGVMIRSGFYGPLFDLKQSPHSPSSFSIWRADTPSTTACPLRIAFAPYNTIIGASMAAESLHYLAGAFDLVDFEHRTFLDFSRGRFVRTGPLDEKSPQ